MHKFFSSSEKKRSYDTDILKNAEKFKDKALSILKVTFGKETFRGNQYEAIKSLAFDGMDCFVLMPTGHGKSLIYQLPILLMEGLAIVISPLIALMTDQCLALNAKKYSLWND